MNPLDWDWTSLARVELTDGSLSARVGPVAWVIGLMVVAWLLAGQPWRKWGKVWGVVDFDLSLPGGKCRIARNTGTAQLAHEAYIELMTRKAALPFDDDYDSIDEVYSSWYDAFGQMRRLLRSLPARELRHNEDLRRLQDLLLAVLNDGLRPHLTRWQNPFRLWLSDARKAQPSVPTPELQKQFPEHADLVADLHAKNEMLADLAGCLREMAQGKPA